jgi:hypothetical protein
MPANDYQHPAGWVAPDAFEEAQRQLHREQIAREQQEAARAALEAEVDHRLTAVRGKPAPVSHPAAPAEPAVAREPAPEPAPEVGFAKAYFAAKE